METYLRYIIITSVAIFIFYIGYLLIFRKERNFKFLRLYLLSSLILALILPINQISISIQLPFLVREKQITPIDKESIKFNEAKDLSDKVIINETHWKNIQSINDNRTSFDFTNLLIASCLIISCILFIRLLISSAKIFYHYINSSKIKMGKFTIIYIDKQIIPFSFFKFIFIDKLIPEIELRQIIEHEKVHGNQYHTIDLLISEIFAAIFWFNPFVWMIKKALQQVHEYLADEGVIKSGYNRLAYQALLVNQASEERLVSVSSNFSYSLIKKRIMMMSEKKSVKTKRTAFLSILPLVIVFLISSASFSAQQKTNVENDSIEIVKIPPIRIQEAFNEELVKETNGIKDAPVEDIKPKDSIPNNDVVAVASPVKMNVFYIGVDNPVSIAVGGVPSEKVSASIQGNGTITGENGNYNVRIKGPVGGSIKLAIYVDGKEVSVKEFRVKNVPYPSPKIGLMKGGRVNKSWLAAQTEVNADLENFDFDLNFEVVGFTMTIKDGEKIKSLKQENGNKFTEEQILLIKQAKPEEEIYFENVMVSAPDGRARNIGSLTFTINEN